MNSPSRLNAQWIDDQGHSHLITGHAITVETPNGQKVQIDLIEHPMGLSVSIIEKPKAPKKRSRSQPPYFNIVPGACNVFFVQVNAPGMSD